MKRVFFNMYTNQVGCDGCDAAEFPDSISEEELNDEAHQRAVDWAESYGIYSCDGGNDCEGDGCENDHDGDICGTWEIYNPKKHDMEKPGGGTWF